MTLFFLSHAGGSAKSYVSFKRFLPKELTVIPLELSGRFSRMKDPLIDNVHDCAAELIKRHKELFKEEYALFGHSMGTVMATELVKQAKENGLAMPKHIFLSGKTPPDIKMQCMKDIENKSDEEIVEYFSHNSLSASTPIPPDHKLIEMLNRILCTDVRMIESHKLTPEDVKFNCDITVFYGKSDPLLQNADLNDWSRFTNGKCEVYSFEGDHFYYINCKEAVCDIIKAKLGL